MLNLTDVEKEAGGINPALEALGKKQLGGIIYPLFPYIFGIAGLIMLLYLVWGGFMFMTSHGDQKAVESARQKITSAIIGFVIIFIAYWLVQLLGKVFGLGDFRLLFKPTI